MMMKTPLVTFVPTGRNHDHDAVFQQLVENPPFPPGAPLEIIRNALDSLGGLNPPVPDDVAIEHVSHETWTGELLTPPTADPKRIILYARGGAFTTGRVPGIWKYPIYRIAKAADASVLIVNYRLAPENPFPAARDDLVSAYRYLLSRSYDARNVVFAGDSAGGGLVLQALTFLRDQQSALPAGAVAIGAWIDVANEQPSRATNANDPLAGLDFLAANAAAYLSGTPPKSPETNPLHADLRGFPPVRLLVGSRESVRDDSLEFARAAARAGVDASVEEWSNLNHGWYIFSHLAESEAAYARIGYLSRLMLADE